MPKTGSQMKKVLALFLALFTGKGAREQETTPDPRPTSAPGRVNLEGDDAAVARWIWRNLVPRQGQGETLQGELLRAVEKLRWEAQTNGNINWDEGFIQFVDFLKAHLASEPGFTPERRRSLQADLERLRAFTGIEEDSDEAEFLASLPCVDDDLYDRLENAVVAFSRLHPVLIPHANDPAQYR
jgi:hypothetical protein